MVPIEVDRGTGALKPGTATPFLNSPYNETQGQFSCRPEGAPGGTLLPPESPIGGGSVYTARCGKPKRKFRLGFEQGVLTCGSGTLSW